MVPLLAVKVAVVKPAATVTDAGTVNAAFPLESVSEAPPAGADLVKVIVHVLDALEPRLLGLQLSDETCTPAVKLMVADLELALYAAVTVAL